MKNCDICGVEMGRFSAITRNYGKMSVHMCSECNNIIELHSGKTINFLQSKLKEKTASPIGEQYIQQVLEGIGIDPGSENKPQTVVISGNQSTSTSNGGGLIVAGICFLILAAFLYFVSVNNNLGVANIQATVFAAGSFICAVICFACQRVIKALK